MKKYFLGLVWQDEKNSKFKVKDYDTGRIELIDLPKELCIEKSDKKICVGTINPYTKEYIPCDREVEQSEAQCNKCKYLFDFYKCVRCHGDTCYAKNNDVLAYCNVPHYVYIACFPNNKIKVGTASEIKKYDRLLEQGAIYSIFIAKTPTGKIARQIEKIIINLGISGAVNISYKMKNIIFNEDSEVIKQKLVKTYKNVIEKMPSENIQYLIEPEFNHFDSINNKIDENMLEKSQQITLFDAPSVQTKNYEIVKDYDLIEGQLLFTVGKILAVNNDGVIQIFDTRKLEGCLLEIHEKTYSSKKIGGK